MTLRKPTAWEVFWILTLGPFFAIGWCLLHASKHVNRVASLWCRFLLSVYPE